MTKNKKNENNIIMNPLYLLIPMAIILLFLMPVVAEARVTFNLQSKTGVICIFVYGIKIVYWIYEIKGKKVLIKNQKETKEKEFDIAGDDLILVEYFAKQIKDKTRLKELFVFYNLGVGDAFESAMIGGLLNVAVLTFFTTLKSSKPTASLGIYDTISYNKNIFEIALKAKISISLFDVVYSFLNSLILSAKTKAEEKHNML